MKARNICRNKSEKQEKEDREKIKKELSRRLSQRPNVEVLKKKKILKFEEYVDVYEVPNIERKAEKPWTKLTPQDKADIRKELNEYKVKYSLIHWTCNSFQDHCHWESERVASPADQTVSKMNSENYF